MPRGWRETYARARDTAGGMLAFLVIYASLFGFFGVLVWAAAILGTAKDLGDKLRAARDGCERPARRGRVVP